MIIKKSEFFEKLYIIDVNKCTISNKQMNTFVLCGDSNWDYYFEKLSAKYPEDSVLEISNIFLHEFENEKDLAYYLNTISSEKTLDLSLEKDFHAVLQLA